MGQNIKYLYYRFLFYLKIIYGGNNCKSLQNLSKKHVVVVYSDASDVAGAAYTVEIDETNFIFFAHRLLES